MTEQRAVVGPDGPPSADVLAERREDIVHAAIEVFYELGAQAADLSQIAERAGLTLEQLEEHGESKATLLVAAAGREAQNFFASVLRQLTEGAPSAAVLVQLIVELQAGPPLSMHHLLAETLATGIRDPDVRRQLDPHLSYASAALAVVIRQAKTDRLIAPDVDVEALAYVVVTLLFGSCTARALAVERPEPDRARNVIVRLVDGLRPTNGQAVDAADAADAIDLRDHDPDGVGPFSPAAGRPPPHGT